MLGRRAQQERLILRAEVVVEAGRAHCFVRRHDDKPKPGLALVQQPERLVRGAATLGLHRHLEPFAHREREVAIRYVGSPGVFVVGHLSRGWSRRLALRSLDGWSRQALSGGRHCQGDPERLCFFYPPACFLFGLRRLPPRVLLGLGLAPSGGFHRLTLGFGFGVRHPLRLGFCCHAPGLCLGGLTRGLRLGSSAPVFFRCFRLTSCFDLRCLAPGLGFGRAPSFRLFNGPSSSLRFRGSPRLGFGHALLLRLGRSTLCLLARRATLGGFLCSFLLVPRARRVGFGFSLRRSGRPIRANPNDSPGGVPRRHNGVTAEGFGDVERRPASRHRDAADSGDGIGWSAPHGHDKPREGSGVLASGRQDRRTCFRWLSRGQRHLAWRGGERNDGRTRYVRGPGNTRGPGCPSTGLRIRYLVEGGLEPASLAPVVKEERAGPTGVAEDQHGLPALLETRCVYGRVRSRDRQIRRRTGAVPAEYFERIVTSKPTAERPNRVGGGTLIE